MDRKNSVSASLCLVLYALSLMGGEPPAKKPNILFIAVDDLRPQLGCYGKKQIVSPHIDRLASEGTMFTRAYCQVPVCGASRASLMTGLRPTPKRFLSYNSRADTDAKGIDDIPKWFKKHGYDTFSMGKIYHRRTDNEASWTQLGSSQIKLDFYRNKDYQRPESHAPKGHKGYNGGAPFESATAPKKNYFQWQLADAAISRLQKMKRSNRPGFLAVGFTKPHLPFVAPKRYWDLYKRASLKLADNPFAPKGAPQKAIHNFNELRNYKSIPKEGPISDDMALSLIHGYYACVSYTDAMIGRMLKELDRLDMRKNTIVILWGDHGWQLGEHSLWCKHSNFNTSLNAPLIISAPGKGKGKTRNSLVEFVDIYPTLCELTGLPKPKHLQGTSMVPLLEGPERKWKKAAFARYHTGDSVRTDRYLYTRWVKDGKTFAQMLYDHKTDPMENVNISELPASAPIVRRMKKLLTDGWKPVAEALNPVTSENK